MKDVYIHLLHLNKHQQSFFEFEAIFSHKNTDLQSLDFWSNFLGPVYFFSELRLPFFELCQAINLMTLRI